MELETEHGTRNRAWNSKQSMELETEHGTRNVSLSEENEKRAARVGFEPTTTAYEADALPTELPPQVSWLDGIKAIQGEGN